MTLEHAKYGGKQNENVVCEEELQHTVKASFECFVSRTVTNSTSASMTEHLVEL